MNRIAAKRDQVSAKLPRSFLAAWWLVIVIAAAAAWVVWTAPEEQTLGQGIRAVYVHVGLTWTGMALFGLAAVLGVLVLVSGNMWLHDWMGSAGWVATAVYAAGVGMSMVASKVNWGAVFLQEPRMTAALSVLGIALIIQIGANWFPWIRLRGGLHVLFLGLLFLLTYQAPLVLHPRDPISTSPSSGIRTTFTILFGLFTAAALLFVWQLRHYYARRH